MGPTKPSRRDIKARLLGHLRKGNPVEGLTEFSTLPRTRLVNALFSFLLSTQPMVKWSAVAAMGAVTAQIAQTDMESARVVMRRLMWQLNDESGGIGWGCPEAMGEIMARHTRLAEEYGKILISYAGEEMNYLEYAPLQQGVVWAIGRVAQVHSDLMVPAVPHLIVHLDAPVPALRGLAAWALAYLPAPEATSRLRALLIDTATVPVYQNGALADRRICDLAREALPGIGPFADSGPAPV